MSVLTANPVSSKQTPEEVVLKRFPLNDPLSLKRLAFRNGLVIEKAQEILENLIENGKVLTKDVGTKERPRIVYQKRYE